MITTVFSLPLMDFLFTEAAFGLEPTSIDVDAAIGDRVWIDTNGNGIQDFGRGLSTGEIGLNGVTVNLLNLDGSIAAQTVTGNGPADAPGFYVFEDIDFTLPVGPNIRVAAPRYTVEFIAPEGYSFTKQDADPAQYLVGESPIDSDADPKTGRTKPVILEPSGLPGAQIFTIDAGLVPDEPVSVGRGVVGDRIFIDTNRNGLQDEGDRGLNGVNVTLFDEEGTFIAETTTANNGSGEAGFYRFAGLNTQGGETVIGPEGLPTDPFFNLGQQYTVEVDLPENYVFTVDNADPVLLIEGDSGRDSDANRATGRFTTNPLTNLIGGLSEVQLNWDAGFIEVDRKLEGTDKGETLKGNGRADSIEGKGGSDRIRGGRGNDVLSGGNGSDRILGQAGNDVLLGGAGNDRLQGSNGRLNDKNESDTLKGGAGNDLFILGNRKGAFYAQGGDRDQALIVDFASGEDKLQLNGSIGDYSVTSDLFSSSIFRGEELVATVNSEFLRGPVDLATDVRFVG